jgi:hypothetical protein
MPTHTLYIVTYDRGLHPVTGETKPYHWAYFLDSNHPSSDSSDPRGIIFQLRGMPGGFYYPGPEQLGISQDGGAGEMRDKLEVGEVKVDKGGDVGGVVESINAVLKEVEIVRDESAGWNCQDWTLEGFERLKGMGIVYGHLKADGVRGWLKER